MWDRRAGRQPATQHHPRDFLHPEDDPQSDTEAVDITNGASASAGALGVTVPAPAAATMADAESCTAASALAWMAVCAATGGVLPEEVRE